MSNNSLPSDLEIARAEPLRPISDVAMSAGIGEEHLEPYGRHVAKVAPTALAALADRPPASYVLVSAMTPTPLGEGKTTIAVGLAQGFALLGRRATLALRQPSMGPTFGIKGGAAGGGYSQVVPMETLNLHLTGDFHAVTAAHDLLAAMVDNHLHHGNELGIDPRSVSWGRVLDVNDRSLRNVVIGLGARADGVPRQAGFAITAASEVMTILALASSLHDLRERVGRIVVGFRHDGSPITAEDLKAAGAMTVILREAVKPNLLQTLEGTPALVHTGPFGNIATGNSSVIADLIGSRTGDFLITEAGFGADLGAERFFNLKCRRTGLRPDAAVVVATVRALKAHSGRYRVVAGKPLPEDLLAESPDDVAAGAANLQRHIDIVRGFGVTPVVAINAFPTDFPTEHEVITELAERAGVRVAVARPVSGGGKGCVDLAEVVAEAVGDPQDFRFGYDLDDSLREKIGTIARDVYGADGVDLSPVAAAALDRFDLLGYGSLPVVIAKTHLSLSSDPKLLGAPTGWRLPIREVRVAAGAGYVYAISGDMRTMPGLPRHPNAENVDIDDDGEIVGLS
jgi:formate--tetrahydrofolate ligase